MKNSQRFLSAYNSIAKELERMLGVNHYTPFYKLVDMAKKKSAVVMTYKDDLKELAHLRNAIVHDKDYPETVIAEPNIAVVEQIENILTEIQKPKLVIPEFQRDVKTFKKTDFLRKALKQMKEHSFSQFPVYDRDYFYGLITDRGIARWIAKNFEEYNGNIFDIELGDVIRDESNHRNVEFMSKDHNVYDIRARFLRNAEIYQTRLEAVLITETGNRNEKLLGMVTPFDIINYKH